MHPEKISVPGGSIGAQKVSVLPREMGGPYQRLHPIVLLLIVTLTVAALWAFSDLAQVFNERWLAPADSPVAPWVIWIFKFYFVVYACGSVLPFALFLFWRSRIDARQTAANDAPLVTIIIPAFNEEANIFGCLAAVLHQDYPFYEVIVLDDGSSDYTPYLIENSGVKLLRLRSNQGKASALNLGVRHAKGDILVFSDADSMLDPSAVGNLVRRFSDPKVGAVAGRVMVARPAGWLRCWQELEYILGQVIVKAAQIGHGSSALICPGPVCAMRRDLLLRLGGFKNDTLVEDFDLTLEVIRAGYQASYEPFAVARTETPQTWSTLARQRLRWSRGSLQVMRKHRALFFAAAGGSIGSFWLPYSLTVGFGGAIFEVFALLSLPFLILGSGAPAATVQAGLAFVLIMEALTLLQYLAALWIDGRCEWRLFSAAVLIKPYNLFLSLIRLRSIHHELSAKGNSW